MFLAVCGVSALGDNVRSVCLVDVFPSCWQWKERTAVPGERTFLRLKYVSFFFIPLSTLPQPPPVLPLTPAL